MTNEYGEVIPLSKTPKYKNIIKTSSVKTCLLKSHNNDSLYKALNKNFSRQAYIGGITMDTLINLKSAATKYKIDIGTIWLFRIESYTAKMLDIVINPLVIPEGAYICIFPREEELKKKGPQLYSKKRIVRPQFVESVYGNQLFIEYFEPNIVDKKANIIITNIGYGFR
jgi:hypothetical protein